ncbi:PMD domain-containing protein [Cephalotus follicularis]|uniref:PMD domain-containing protein n=1 Tax=Cephalotus follicularis TaxID=3775 RepID=A0A1Q3BHC2_CEPFO|nr:PMD domain-containing protein [Cephalotus follicularis]
MLKDVMTLYHLPSLAVLANEQEHVDNLCRLIMVIGKHHSQIILECGQTSSAPPKRPSFNCWIRYFCKEVDESGQSYDSDGFGTPLEFVAFFFMWLSKYISPSNPQDRVSKLVFPLSLKLS